MKYKREIKVALLAIVCVGLMYFGFYFLKGVNIFSPVKSYIGMYDRLNGLTEQAPVYIRGYKVGQVDHISYDFTQSEAFTIQISVDRHIAIPKGSEMILMSDGLLGGKAIEIQMTPVAESDLNADFYADGDTIVTGVERGYAELLQDGLLTHLDSVICEAQDLVASLNNQLSDNQIQHILMNIDGITADLRVTAKDMKSFSSNQLPSIAANLDTTMQDVQVIAQTVRQAELEHTLLTLDSTLQAVQQILTTGEGTLGLLLNDKALYNHIDSTVLSVDNLVNDLKQNPKKYINVTVFGKKEK